MRPTDFITVDDIEAVIPQGHHPSAAEEWHAALGSCGCSSWEDLTSILACPVLAQPLVAAVPVGLLSRLRRRAAELSVRDPATPPAPAAALRLTVDPITMSFLKDNVLPQKLIELQRGSAEWTHQISQAIQRADMADLSLDTARTTLTVSFSASCFLKVHGPAAVLTALDDGSANLSQVTVALRVPEVVPAPPSVTTGPAPVPPVPPTAPSPPPVLPAGLYSLLRDLCGSVGQELPSVQPVPFEVFVDLMRNKRGIQIRNSKALTLLYEQVVAPFMTCRNIKTVKGALLYGPPGTAKSTLAKNLATRLGFVLLDARSASSFAKSYVGETEAEMTALFDRTKARPNAVHLLVIEELDALGEQRQSGPNAHHSKWLSHFFDLMDSTDNVLLIGTTNRRDVLDTALVRPDRVEVLIFCGKPQPKETVQIFVDALEVAGMAQAAAEVAGAVQSWIPKLSGFSGAQAVGAVNFAARRLQANRQEQNLATTPLDSLQTDLEWGIAEVISNSNDADLAPPCMGLPPVLPDAVPRELSALTGRMMLYNTRLRIEMVQGGVKSVDLLGDWASPALRVFLIGKALQQAYGAATVMIVDSRRKEFFGEEASPPLLHDVSASGANGGVVVVVHADDMVALVTDVSRQSGVSLQKNDGVVQEFSTEQHRFARESVFQRLVSFANRATLDSQRAHGAFIVLAVVTSHSVVERRFASAMHFELPPAPFAKTLAPVTGCSVETDGMGQTSIVRRTTAVAAGPIPILSAQCATRGTPVLFTCRVVKSQQFTICMGCAPPGSVTAGKQYVEKEARAFSFNFQTCQAINRGDPSVTIAPFADRDSGDRRVVLLIDLYRKELRLFADNCLSDDQEPTLRGCFHLPPSVQALHLFLSMADPEDIVATAMLQRASSMPPWAAKHITNILPDIVYSAFSKDAFDIARNSVAERATFLRATRVTTSWQPIIFAGTVKPGDSCLMEFTVDQAHDGNVWIGFSTLQQATGNHALYDADSYVFRIHDMSLYHKGNVAKYFPRPENYNKASRRKFGLLFARDPHNEHQLQFRVYWTDADGNNMTFQESYTGTSTATYYPAVSMHWGGDKITLHQLLFNTDIPHRYRAQLPILHEFRSWAPWYFQIMRESNGSTVLQRVDGNVWQPVFFHQRDIRPGDSCLMEFTVDQAHDGTVWIGFSTLQQATGNHTLVYDADSYVFCIHDMSLYHKGNVAKYFPRPENYNKASRRKFGLLFARDPHNEHQLQFRVYWTDADGNNMTFQESYTGTSTATYYPAVSMHYGGDKITLHQLLWNTDIPVL